MSNDICVDGVCQVRCASLAALKRRKLRLFCREVTLKAFTCISVTEEKQKKYKNRSAASANSTVPRVWLFRAFCESRADILVKLQKIFQSGRVAASVIMDKSCEKLQH